LFFGAPVKEVAMKQATTGSEARFAAYVEALAQALGHADRTQPFQDYCTGLLMPCERKSVEPMAAAVDPARVSAEHQSLLHFVGQAPWSDAAALAKVYELAAPAIQAHGGPIEAWIVDDTGFAKKGVHSVGVARQYCGRLGKTDNCQIAVTLSIANHAASLPIAYRLYLPEDWASDPARRQKAKVPDDVKFQTKPEIALDQIRTALAAGVAPGMVLADAGYGIDGGFRAGVTALELAYAVGVQSTLSVWPPGMEPLPPAPWSGRGRQPSRVRRDADHAPVCAKTLALGLAPQAWRAVSWREGSNADLSSRFAAVRIRPASRDWKRSTPHPLEWLLIEWPDGEAEPTKYWLSTLPEDIAIEALVDAAKLRWRIERDYEELKSELGLAHFEGRGWRGFHHHATLCIAAYGFLIRERAAFPPSNAKDSEKPRLPDRPRPRGAADPARASRRQFDRNNPTRTVRRLGENATQMPVLPSKQSTTQANTAQSSKFMTQ
jgi:SRSO17 transposase